jgi:hypothetical protein
VIADVPMAIAAIILVALEKELNCRDGGPLPGLFFGLPKLLLERPPLQRRGHDQGFSGSAERLIQGSIETIFCVLLAVSGWCILGHGEWTSGGW